MREETRSKMKLKTLEIISKFVHNYIDLWQFSEEMWVSLGLDPRPKDPALEKDASSE